MTDLVVLNKTMLSTEIGALAGKRHNDIMRDIRVIISQLSYSAELRSGFKKSTYEGVNGQLYKCYELSEEAAKLMLDRYSGLARVPNRLQE
jgi:phage regulator Rha-like protein